MIKEIYDKLVCLTEEELKIINGETYINKSIYTDERNFIIDSNKLLTNDELISIRKHTRFIDFPSHKHNYIEFNYVYQGKLTQIIDKKEITLQRVN